MTKDLGDKLISYYELGITAVKLIDSFTKIQSVLEAQSLELGICHCSIVVFDEVIHWDEWVRSLLPEGSFYWLRPPSYCINKEEVLNSLQKRVDILKTFNGY